MTCCTNCGADWDIGAFGPDCVQCGGGALDRPCPLCGGRCGSSWRRAVLDSLDSNEAHWVGQCQLSPDRALGTLSRAGSPTLDGVGVFRHAAGGGAEQSMRKDAFYSGKRVVRVEWWLHECDLPDTIRWARLRVFQDGSADACFEEGGKLHAFDARDHAARILSEDEYCSIEGMDRADEREFGFDVAQLAPPDWVDPQDQAFEYHGTY